MKVLSRESSLWTLKGNLVHKPMERNMMLIHPRKKNKRICSEREILKRKGLIQFPCTRCTVQTPFCKLHLSDPSGQPMSLVVHWTAGTTSVAGPTGTYSTFWANGEHIFSSMRNDMCHKANRSWGVGWKATSRAGSSMMPVHGIAHWRICPPLCPPKEQ